MGDRKETIRSKAQSETTVRGHAMEKGDVYRFAALIAIFAVVIVSVVLMWPMLKDLFSEGGVSRLVEHVRSAGAAGVVILLGLQLFQVIVAFIPGEVVQIAAGLVYGPWLGALIMVVGALMSSALVYQMVHKLGAPFVQKMAPQKYLDKITRFEDSNKFEVIVFLLFFIPGLPKDAFTYLLPLTRIKMRPFLILTTVARTPAIVASTVAASGFADGNITLSVVIMVVVGGIAVVGIIFQNRIIDFVSGRVKGGRGTPSGS